MPDDPEEFERDEPELSVAGEIVKLKKVENSSGETLVIATTVFTYARGTQRQPARDLMLGSVELRQ